MVKNLPAVRETWARSLDWEGSLEEGMATHSSILAWRIPVDRRARQTAVHGVTKKSDTTERLSTAHWSFTKLRARLGLQDSILQTSWKNPTRR